MRIFQGGNVLIQTGGTFTDAGYKLSVNGTGNFSGALTGTSATFSGSVIVGTTALLNFGPTSSFVGMSGNNSTGSLALYANNTQVLGFAASTGAATFSGALTGTSATFSAALSLIGTTPQIFLNRTANTNSNAIIYQTASTNDWFIGSNPLGANDSDYNLYSYGTSSIVLKLARATAAATFSSSITATQGNFNQTATSGFAINMTNRNNNQTWSVIVDTDAVDDKILGFQSSYGFTPFYALKLDAVGGAATFSSSIKTAAPSGGTAKPFKIGAAATVTPTSQNRTIEIEIDGVTYYLTAKTTND